MSPIQFPSEILVGLFWPLDVRSLCRVSRVCHRFRKIADDDRIWREFFRCHLAIYHLHATGFKLLARRIYPIWGLVQGQYRETRIAGECLLSLRSFYDSTSNRLFVVLENHRHSICTCPERVDDPDVQVAAGEVYDMGSQKKVSPFFGGHWNRPGPPVAMRFDAAKREFLTFSESHICWNDLDTGKVKQKILLSKATRVDEVFSTHSTACVGCHVIDLQKKKVLYNVPWPESIHAYDEKHRWMIAYFNSSVRIYKAQWKVGLGMKRQVTFISSLPGVEQLRRQSSRNFEYLPETQRFVCLLTNRKTIMVFDLKTKERKFLNVAPGIVECLVRTSSYLVMAIKEDNHYRFDRYDLATLDLVSSFHNDEGLSVWDLQYHPQSGVMLAVSKSSLSLWDVASEICLKRIPYHNQAWYRVEWDPERKTIALHFIPYFQGWGTRLICY